MKKRIITLWIILLAFAGVATQLNAQEQQVEPQQDPLQNLLYDLPQEPLQTAPQQQQSEPLTRSERREIRRAQQRAESEARYQLALRAINEGTFVLEADRITFRRGQSVFVNSGTNFVMVNGQRATVQSAFNTVRPGPNGIGGITVVGNISNPTVRISRRGNVTYTFGVQGAAISARIVVKMHRGNNRATAEVSPNFNSNRQTFSGIIVPLSQSRVFRARAL